MSAETGLIDANHALLVGELIGLLMNMESRGSAPTQVRPVLLHDRAYTNQIEVTRPSGLYRITVEKVHS